MWTREPKFCPTCGQAIVHGARTLYQGYDTQTGKRKERTTQEWWCPGILEDYNGWTHVASYKHA